MSDSNSRSTPSLPPGIAWLQSQQHLAIATLALAGIGIHLVLRFGIADAKTLSLIPLWVALLLGGGPLVLGLLRNLVRREFGSDLLAGISIVTAVILGEYLAGTLVVLMLSGGETLEAYAVRRASSALGALARRMPSVAHRRQGQAIEEISVSDVRVDDVLVVFPHEACPADGVVVEGHGSMDESYLTGEPYRLSKAPGADVISGAVNGEHALTIRVARVPSDSRYARIMQVMQESEQHRPQLRRIGDQLGALFTPIALSVAAGAWVFSGEPLRFLAVLVVATPCPLLIAIPVVIIGAVSQAARRSIVIRDPAILENLDRCRIAIFDKTGTLTYGRPQLAEVINREGTDANEILRLVASLEQYSKHPLATAVLEEAEHRGITPLPATEVREPPGRGLTGTIQSDELEITGRQKLAREEHPDLSLLPPTRPGLECVVLRNGSYVATLQFRDQLRPDGASFIQHLRPRHQFERILLVTGDRDSEARALAASAGIEQVFSEQSPEQKLQIVRDETGRAPTLYVGDGINDAPAMAAATIGIAFGQNSDVTVQAAGAVIMDSRLQKIDELLHLGRRLRRIALQSAVGGIIASLGGMILAALGYLPPVAGALFQEAIDVVAVLNALRMSVSTGELIDFDVAASDKRETRG